MRTEKVSFYSEGIKLSGVLYLPDADQAKPYPGIVQGPGFLGLKDAKHYIMMFEKLCAAGYACLCFDYRGWGESDARLVLTDAYTEAWQPSEKPFMTAIMTFAAEGNKTRYTARVLHWSVADRQAHEEMGFYSGWATATDQLEELLAKQQTE